MITRFLQKEIEQELENDKILIVLGPRQSGKTTLLKRISEKLEERGEQVHFYNFDRTNDLDFFKSQQKVEAFLKIRSIKQRMYIFIDEVQRMKNAGTFFKYFYDAGVNAKFIFSGSSSVEIKDEFGDALTGRKRVFTLLPLSLAEVAANTLGDEWIYAQAGDPQALEKFSQLVETSLLWGNYPEVSTNALEEQKLKAIGELYESYVQKDIKDLMRVKNIAGFNLLVKVLAHSVGSPLVVEDLVRQTGLHTNTVNSYLDILEGTMILARTDNFNPNFDEKLPKSERFYFLDNGMRNYSISSLSSDYRPDWQQLAANLVFSELKKTIAISHESKQGETNKNQEQNKQAENQHARLSDMLSSRKLKFPNSEIYHYQTYSDNHIDFVIKSKTKQEFTPIFVAYPETREKLGKKIHEYLNTQQPKKLYIITKDQTHKATVKGCEITWLPLVEFLAVVG